MQKNKVLLILLIIFFLTTSIVSVIYFFHTTIAIKEYPLLLLVGDKVGIDVGTDIIRFGRIKPGGGSTRTFIVTNDNSIDAIVKMTVLGDLKGHISVSDNNFILKPEEKKEIQISAGMPKDAKFGDYTGSLRIILKRRM